MLRVTDAINLFGLLYKVERQAAELDPEERLKSCREKAISVLAELRASLDSRPEEQPGGALSTVPSPTRSKNGPRHRTMQLARGC